MGQENSLEEEMATHFGLLAWRIPWTGYIVHGILAWRIPWTGYIVHAIAKSWI